MANRVNYRRNETRNDRRWEHRSDLPGICAPRRVRADEQQEFLNLQVMAEAEMDREARFAGARR